MDFVPATDRERKAPTQRPPSRVCDDEFGGNAGTHNIQALKEQAREIQLQIDRLKHQASRHTAYKATPSDLADESREYALHARTRPSSGSSTVWIDDDFHTTSSGPPPLAFHKADSEDDSSDYDAQGRSVESHRAR